MGLISTTLLKLSNKIPNNPVQNWAKDFHRHFSKLQAHLTLLLCFTDAVLFNKRKARPSASKKDYNSLYCNTHFYCGGLEQNQQYL